MLLDQVIKGSDIDNVTISRDGKKVSVYIKQNNKGGLKITGEIDFVEIVTKAAQK